MKTLILSYSFTGNNETLAKSITSKMNAEHISITEPKQRTIGTIFADILFARTPKTDPKPEVLASYDLVIFFAPIWIGQPASPLKAYLKQLKKQPKKYAFVTVSGGSVNSKSELSGTLLKKTGTEAIVIVDLPVTDFMPADVKPDPKTVSEYKLSEKDFEKLTDKAYSTLKANLPKEVWA